MKMEQAQNMEGIIRKKALENTPRKSGILCASDLSLFIELRLFW